MPHSTHIPTLQNMYISTPRWNTHIIRRPRHRAQEQPTIVSGGLRRSLRTREAEIELLVAGHAPADRVRPEARFPRRFDVPFDGYSRGELCAFGVDEDLNGHAGVLPAVFVARVKGGWEGGGGVC